MEAETASTGSAPEFRIFYSWQSDTDGSVGKNFTISALEAAVSCLNNRVDKPRSYVADHGCAGDGGALNISNRMLEKIDNSDLYIADLTIVHSIKTDPVIHGRRAPNPNVMFELGYAVKKLTWEKVIMIINESYGQIDLLPFDVKQHRIVPYKREPNQATETKSKLDKLRKAHTKDITGDDDRAIREAMTALDKIQEIIRLQNQPSAKDAKNELVKDLMSAIAATETENIGVSYKNNIEEVVKNNATMKTQVDEVKTAQQKAESREKIILRGTDVFNAANSIDPENFPVPSPFLRGRGESYYWKKWVQENSHHLRHTWDHPAHDSTILSTLSRTSGYSKSDITYEGIVSLVQKYYKSDGVMRHGYG